MIVYGFTAKIIVVGLHIKFSKYFSQNIIAILVIYTAIAYSQLQAFNFNQFTVDINFLKVYLSLYFFCILAAGLRRDARVVYEARLESV